MSVSFVARKSTVLTTPRACYRGGKQASKLASNQAREAKAATIERLSLSSVPSHTRKGVNWQGHTLVELPEEYSSHPNI
jgi:hypothetical protein